MTRLQRLTDVLAEAVSRTGPAAPAILFLASFVEYVFPPFPGDLVVVLGAWYAAHGELSWPIAFLSVTAGAVAGAFVDHQVGVSVGRRLDARAGRRGGLSAERLARFEASYRRWGPALLAANRFLPGVRAFVFVAAGASGIPLRTVLVFGAVSAALWNALLLALGGLAARNVDELVGIVDQYTRAATVALVALALLAVVWLAWRRRAARARRARPPAAVEKR
ncbi:DedA family protein [Anaeromyxobacter oryzisoli]|uniref:DedA family protein n=1 Tax=Anaeromyxobacter oryzisoli TaxID=2925408 RepID=UPI001F58AABC|nr:DedA family protein [Anaeromyxobacter sp. SG63]